MLDHRGRKARSLSLSLYPPPSYLPPTRLSIRAQDTSHGSYTAIMLSNETRLARRSPASRSIYILTGYVGCSRGFFADKIDRTWRRGIIPASRLRFRDNGATPAAREEMKKGVSGGRDRARRALARSPPKPGGKRNGVANPESCPVIKTSGVGATFNKSGINVRVLLWNTSNLVV